MDGEIPSDITNVKVTRSPASAGQAWDILLNTEDLTIMSFTDTETFGAGDWLYRVVFEDAQGNDRGISNQVRVTFPTVLEGTAVPSDSWTVTKIKDWLDGQGVDYPSNATKAELLELVEG